MHGGLVGVFTALLLACFAPASTATEPAKPEPRRVTYRHVGDRDLSAFVFAPANTAAKPAPAILLFHGGGWRSGSPEWTFTSARRFADLGLVAIAVEYRLSNGGSTPIEALDDTCAAFAWASRDASALGIDASRIAAYGVSAGGHLVATAASAGCPAVAGGQRTRVAPVAMILFSPALDMARDGWFGKLLDGRAKAEAYSPVDHSGAHVPPTLIVQGDADTLTPARGATAFCAPVTAVGGICEIASYPGLGHLLTRNLSNQEDDFDPDPVASRDATVRQKRFLEARGLVSPTPATEPPAP